MARSSMKTAEQEIIRTARAFIDEFGDLLSLTPEQYLAAHALSEAFREYDEIIPSRLDTPNHAANADGPDTQHEAAVWMLPPLSTAVRSKVLTMMQVREHQFARLTQRGMTDEGVYGMTVWQLVKALEIPHQTVSSAVNWAQDNGWVVDSGERRANPATGRRAIVWVLTLAAHKSLRGEA